MVYTKLLFDTAISLQEIDPKEMKPCVWVKETYTESS